MAVHGFLFRGSANDANLSPIPPVEDETTFVNGNDLMVPDGHTSLVMAYALGTDLSRAVFDSPRIRQISRGSISPIDAAANPTSLFPVAKMLESPLPVEPGEALNALAQNTGNAAQGKVIAAWLADGPVNPITGADVRTVRGTTDFDTAANTWNSGQITLETDLPAGTYTVVGFRAEGADLLAARIIFAQQGYRPMVVGSNSASEVTDPIFRMGRLGALGTFQNFVAPKLEVYAGGALSDPVVYLDVVRTGA